MFDLGWTELLLIGVVALIVVGPKDLPVLFRTLGRLTGKARAMAREFTQAMNDAADEAGVREMSETMRKVADPRAFGTDALRDAAGWVSEKSDTEERLKAQRDKVAADKARSEARAVELAASAEELEVEPEEATAPKETQ